MNKIEREHHEFGPWLKEVESVEGIPPQYMAYEGHILSARYKVKVPINKDRKDVEKGSLLYTSVVCFYDDDLRIYSHDGFKVAENIIPYKAIQFVIHTGELLSTYIEIVTSQTSYKIIYHSVSQDITGKILELLRREMLHPFADNRRVNAIHETLETIQWEGGYEYQLYNNLVSKIGEESVLKVLGYQPIMPVSIQGKVKAPRLRSNVSSHTLQDTLFVTNGKELIIAGRANEIKGARDLEYSFRHIFIPIGRINNIRRRNDDEVTSVWSMIFDVDHISLTVKVSEEFKGRGIFDYLRL